MSALLPAAVYGLEIPNGDVMVPAVPDFPAAFRITMAALDPTASPEFTGNVAAGTTPRATLKLIRQPLGSEDDYLNGLDLDEIPSDEDVDDEDSEDDEDEEVNGGPSDPSKTKRARKQAAIDSLKEAFMNGGAEDDDMSVNEGAVVLNRSKGKAKVFGDEEQHESSESDEEEGLEMEEFVICTLDPSSHYQQPLDVTVGEDERVFFKVTGTHTIYLTGNYVIPVDDRDRGDYDSEDSEDEMLMGEDELDDELDSEESDELDDLEDPRVTELDSDDEAEVPKLVQKGKNKRAAAESDEEEATLDDLMAKSLKAEKPVVNGEKLSKKQQKKLKNNAGNPVAAASTAKVEADGSAGKKVSFAKNLEQGPTGTAMKSEKKVNGTSVEKTKVAAPKEAAKTNGKDDKARSGLGVTMIQGVKIDVKKTGAGSAAKKNSKVSMRYIGKLKDGKQFDANKKGKPFSFVLGRGEVIKGWEIGLDGIRAGDERRIIIPPNLAYGKKALPGIPANSELIFDVKCLEVS